MHKGLRHIMIDFADNGENLENELFDIKPDKTVLQLS
jgi:hypothetical protein